MTDTDAGTHPRPWGYWATSGWAILATAVSMLVAVLVTLLWRPDIMSKPVDLLNDGALLSFSTTAWNVVQIGALAFVARLAHWPPSEYLALVRPNGRDAMIALVSLAAFLAGWDALTYLLGRDIVTPFQEASYLSARTSGALPLLWF